MLQEVKNGVYALYATFLSNWPIGTIKKLAS